MRCLISHRHCNFEVSRQLVEIFQTVHERAPGDIFELIEWFDAPEGQPHLEKLKRSSLVYPVKNSDHKRRLLKERIDRRKTTAIIDDDNPIAPIVISGDTIMRQAHMTAHDYLMHAIRDINELMGEGAAEKYPQIVAAMIQAAATDGGATVIAKQVRLGFSDLGEVVAEIHLSLDNVAENVRSDHPLMAESFEGLEGALRSIAEMLKGLKK